MKIDKIFLEIFKNRVQAIVEEMANVVLRTGFTAFVKETGDFGTYLLSPGGETFGSPLATGFNLSLGIPTDEVLAAFDELYEGDIVIANDPYSSSTNGHWIRIGRWQQLRVSFLSSPPLLSSCCPTGRRTSSLSGARGSKSSVALLTVGGR
jgi:hypothetical protein